MIATRAASSDSAAQLFVATPRRWVIASAARIRCLRRTSTPRCVRSPSSRYACASCAVHSAQTAAPPSERPSAPEAAPAKSDRRAAEKQRRARPGNLIGHGGPIKALAVDAATGRALTGSFDYAMMVWDVGAEVPVRLHRLDDHNGAVNAVAFVPGGKLALAAGDDGAVARVGPRHGQARAPLHRPHGKDRRPRRIGGRPLGRLRQLGPHGAPVGLGQAGARPRARRPPGAGQRRGLLRRRRPRLQRQRRRHDRPVERGRRQLPAPAPAARLGHQRAGASAQAASGSSTAGSTARWRWSMARPAPPSWSSPPTSAPCWRWRCSRSPASSPPAAATASFAF